MEGLTAAGLGSGLDIKSLVDQLVAAERQPTANRINLQAARANQELSSIGKLKSALSELDSALENLTDLSKFQARKTLVDEPDLVSVTADNSAAPGTYSVDVLAVATNHKIASQAYADSITPVGYGTLSITLGGVTVEVDIDQEANTLLDIRDAINDAPDNPGLVASVVTADDGARLILTSTETGTASEFSISSSGGDGGLADLDYSTAAPGLNAEITLPADAQLTVDGFTITSSSNTIAGAIEGVTISLLDADPGNTFDFEVQLDEAAGRESLTKFVDAYNAVVAAINQETAFDEESEVAGTLLGDATIRGIQNRLRSELSRVLKDSTLTFGTLAEIGILTSLDGTLEIDSAKLDEAIAVDFTGVGRLFTSASGIGTKLDEYMSVVLDDEGLISGREDTLRAQIDDAEEARERLDQRMEAVRRRLEIQFNAMDQFVSQLSTTSQFLAQQLGP